jgi:hypothetical protein
MANGIPLAYIKNILHSGYNVKTVPLGKSGAYHNIVSGGCTSSDSC